MFGVPRHRCRSEGAYRHSMAGRLVVIDNADSFEALANDELFKALLPTRNSALHLLIISRSCVLPLFLARHLVAKVEVTPLQLLETAGLFCQLAGRQPLCELLPDLQLPESNSSVEARVLHPTENLDSSLSKAGCTSMDKQELCSLLFLSGKGVLGGLPLAVEIAAAHLKETGCSFAQYKDHLLARNAKETSKNEECVVGELDECDDLQKLFLTWRMSFEALTCAGRQLLSIASCFHPDNIPCLLFLTCPDVLSMPTELRRVIFGRDGLSSLTREHRLLSLLSELKAFSFVSFDKPSQAVRATPSKFYQRSKSFPPSQPSACIHWCKKQLCSMRGKRANKVWRTLPGSFSFPPFPKVVVFTALTISFITR